MTSSSPTVPLVFENLDKQGEDPTLNPDFNKTVVSIKADGRAWAYQKGLNYWYLIDVSVLRFFGIDPIVASVNNAEVTYEIDLSTVTKPN
jgi:hypothetical protein